MCLSVFLRSLEVGTRTATDDRESSLRYTYPAKTPTSWLSSHTAHGARAFATPHFGSAAGGVRACIWVYVHAMYVRVYVSGSSPGQRTRTPETVSCEILLQCVCILTTPLLHPPPGACAPEGTSHLARICLEAGPVAHQAGQQPRPP